MITYVYKVIQSVTELVANV